MVCSGVFVLVRSSYILEYTPSILLVILWLGGITTLVSGLIAVVSNDIKRVIALSTMSQLARKIYYSPAKPVHFKFRNQTICEKLYNTIFPFYRYIYTRLIGLINLFRWVINGWALPGYPPAGPVNYNNSQITKAHKYLYTYINYVFITSFYVKHQYLYLKIWLLIKNKVIYILHIVNITLYHLVKVNIPTLLEWLNKESGKWKIRMREAILPYFLEAYLPVIISKLVGISETIRLMFMYIYTLIIPGKAVKLSKKKTINPFRSTPPTGGGGPIPRNAGDRSSLSPIYNKSQIRFLHHTCTSLKEKAQDIELVLNDKNKLIESPGEAGGLNKDLAFNQWLAGLIDGDGYFNLSKKGTARFQLTMDARDLSTLYEIKHKFGGRISSVSGANAFRYQLSHKKGLIYLINSINGEIRNPKRLLQINKLCIKYNIVLIMPKPLTYYNGWLSGFLDSDGSIYYSESSGQVFISIAQKNKYLLDPLIELYSGRVYIFSPKTEAFRYQVYRKNDLFNLIDNYFIHYPLRTLKLNRLNLIKEFYDLRTYKNNLNDLKKLNDWIDYKDRWDKYLPATRLDIRGTKPPRILNK